MTPLIGWLTRAPQTRLQAAQLPVLDPRGTTRPPPPSMKKTLGACHSSGWISSGRSAASFRSSLLLRASAAVAAALLLASPSVAHAQTFVVDATPGIANSPYTFSASATYTTV